jgi:hypothetical protein
VIPFNSTDAVCCSVVRGCDLVNKTVIIQTVGRPNELCKQTTSRPAARQALSRGPTHGARRGRRGHEKTARNRKSAYRTLRSGRHLLTGWDGRPALQILEHSDPDSNPIRKIVTEIVHVHETREELLAAEEPVLIEWSGVRDANGSGGLNEDTARTKR